MAERNTAKLFMNGRSQAVRLPKEYRFDGDEVMIRKVGDEVILSRLPRSWKEFAEEVPAPSPDFMTKREDAPPQRRDDLW